MTEPGAGARNWLRRHAHAVAILALAALMLAMFADVLFTTQDTLLSAEGTDLYLQDVFWREFAFRELRRGNFPLWNPHIFSGAPFYGGMQSGLLYLPNYFCLILSLPKGINATIALHVFLMGLFMYLWAWRRRLHPLACFTAGVMLMFSGQYFLHIYAGHLGRLNAMVWAPLIFLSVDGFLEERAVRWILLGMFAVGMQLFAGDPQYVFYTAIAVGFYGLLRIWNVSRPGHAAIGLAVIYMGGAALGAVELLTGFQVAGESVRGTGLPYEIAVMFSYPPEDFITFIAPGFFGNLSSFPYWGRCYLWEMSVFVGVTGFVLAIYGFWREEPRSRRVVLILLVVLVILALGARTPLFPLLYRYAPGFNRFRGTSKFMFPASLFLGMLAAVGQDALLRRFLPRRRVAFAILISGALLGMAGVVFQAASVRSAPSWWVNVVQAIEHSRESYIDPRHLARPDFWVRSAQVAAASLILGGGTLLLLAPIFILAPRRPLMVYTLPLLLSLEMFMFARAARATFELSAVRAPPLADFIRTHPGEYRIVNLHHPNSAMAVEAYDVWGYAPLMQRRYAEFMAFTQGHSPDAASQYLIFRQFHPLYDMLRLGYVVYVEERRTHIRLLGEGMGRVHLISQYVVARDRDAALRLLDDARFDPRRTVVLEEKPEPEPVVHAEGSARVVAAGTDWLTIEAEVSAPAILLVTDAYSVFWRARSLPGSSQKHYRVLPANYALQAIPVGAGQHRLRLEYKPPGFVAGKYISLASWLCLATAAGALFWRRRQCRKGVSPP